MLLDHRTCENLTSPCSSPQEFEIELEGSQTLRLLCYEKSYNKSKQNKEDGDGTDRIMGKGQIPVRRDVTGSGFG